MLPILVLVFLLHTSNATTINYTKADCFNSPTFAPTSSYATNLNLLLSTLVSNISTTKNGFLIFTSGRRSPEPTYGLAMCRGDVELDECQDCLQMASNQVVNICPKAKEATIWMEECMLRYSNKSIFSLARDYPQLLLQNTNNATDATHWIQLVENTMNDITSMAANDTSGKKFATKEAIFSPTSQMLYTLAQCTPDLTPNDCSKCFDVATSYLPILRIGGIVLTPSCNVRYETYPFYQRKAGFVPSPIQTPPTNITTGKKKVSAAKVIVIVIVALAILGMLIAVGIYFFKKKAKKYDSVNQGHVFDDFTTADSLLFELSTLQAATNDFSDDHKLGEGGFGSVYKGTLPDGKEIAVKRLSRYSGQGAEEFKNEVVLVAKLQHRNLVRLLGFCLAGEEKLLVYEFVPNKSLNHFVFDPENQGILNWPRRYNIIKGIARGMLYLHEDSRLRIIHRDLKPSNILLDADMNPKISDFGMARIFGNEQSEDKTSRVVGTYGYMAPEYAMHGQFSVKSDVYSFGVLVLEIISGKKISGFNPSGIGEDLLSHAWRGWRDGGALEFMDPTLRDSYSSDEVLKCIHLGLLCVQEDIHERPTMASIVMMLNTYSTTTTLSMPRHPAYFYRSDTESVNMSRPDQSTTTTTSTGSSMPWSVNEATISELVPR